MRRPEIVPAVFSTEPVHNAAKTSHGLAEADHRSLVIASSQANLTQNAIELPLVLGRTRLACSPKCSSDNVPVLRVVDPTCNEDLSQDEGPAKLDAQTTLPSNVKNDARQRLDSCLRVVLSSDILQFDLDSR